MRQKLCGSDDLGQFITDLPAGQALNSTSIWTRPVALGNTSSLGNTAEASSLWDNPAGNPVLPAQPPGSQISSLRRSYPNLLMEQDIIVREVLAYNEPLRYPVNMTGYYCTGELSR